MDPTPPPNPYASPDSPMGGTQLKPGRGVMILVFGILGLFVCLIFGICAWVMGKADLAEMAAGRMDPADQGMTKAGYILGIISCALAVLGLVIAVVIIAGAVVAS